MLKKQKNISKDTNEEPCFCQECREQCKVCRALDKEKAMLNAEIARLKAQLEK